MTAATKGTRIFGIRVSFDPKILIGFLIVLAVILFWYNSGSEDSATAIAALPQNGSAVALPPPSAAIRPTSAQRRTGAPVNDRSTLRLRPIDATRGDVDPTLRLDLLKRLSSIQPSPATRSLFEIGAIIPSTASGPGSIHGPILTPKPLPPLTNQPSSPIGGINTAVNIPFKYYGFAKPTSPNSINRGLFLDGDNVLVATEGETVKQRYLVVELTPNSARLEDTQLKQGQTLPVVPVALP